MVADAGDVYLTMYDIALAVLDIERQYDVLLSSGCKILTMGGDHTITYPILKAYKVFEFQVVD
jgi:arginase family enzyme